MLWQARPSQELEEAHQQVLRDYVALKRATLSPEMRRLEEQWGCPFAAFQEQTKGEYAYEGESPLWDWEWLETLQPRSQAQDLASVLLLKSTVRRIYSLLLIFQDLTPFSIRPNGCLIFFL